jgi:acetyl-CoA acyltransferase
MTDAYVYDAIRTRFGRFGGALAGVRPDDLAATVITSLLARHPSLDAGAIDEVVFGNANGAGEENRNVARMASLLAGLPVTVPGTTVNRLCGSSLDAAIIASRQVQCGEASVIVSGGVESMTRAPWVLPKPSRGYPAGDLTAVSTALGWRLVNPAMPSEWTVSLGEANELVADRFGITRERQDLFALRSHHNAARAWDEGFYDDLVCPVPDVDLVRDEGVRPDATSQSLGKLEPSFRRDGTGTITAGNASPLSDGAAAVLLGDAEATHAIGREPLARVAGRGAVALAPQDFGLAPIGAVEKAMKAAGIGWADVDLVELNEAFAAQSLACIDHWDIDPDAVNPYGGAIAMGHPLGASGARLLGTLVAGLRRTGGRYGVAALCIGVGQGLAVVVENTDTSAR